MVDKQLMSDFKSKIKELFRSDDSSFNWGIYRIINQRNKDIDSFIEKEIPVIIEKNLNKLNIKATSDIDKEIEKIKINAQSVGIDYKELPKYKEMLKQKKELGNISEYDSEIYNYLLEFFSKYYLNGDFISRFYFKNGSYVVPYDGSEVYMHWLTKEQYYVKTTDEYKRFSVAAGKISIVLRVIEATQEKGNEKEKGKKVFVLDNDNPFEFVSESNELFVNLNHIVETEEMKKDKLSTKKRQEQFNQEIINKIIEESHVKGNITDMSLKSAMDKFQKRYTEDFFIHKNLNGFLTNELQYYIQNEILRMDAVIRNDTEINKELIVKTQTFCDIATEIISRLSVIEDLKKKIWEKKKFILETNYIITLDKIVSYISEEFLEKILDEIIANKKQIEEWKELFNINVKTKKDLFVGVSQKKLEETTKEWLKLPIDTKYFDEKFKYYLLIALSEKNDIDNIIDGVFIKSENWQALNLLQEKYKEKIRAYYIDPPYATGQDDFLYKDTFKTSSWLSMMNDRISISTNLLKKQGVSFTSIANNAKYYYESYKLNILLDSIFDERLGELVWKRRSGSGSNTISDLTEQHEYVPVYGKKDAFLYKNLMSEERFEEYKFKDDKGIYRWNDTVINQYTKHSRPNLFYPVIYNVKTKQIFFNRTKAVENEVIILPSKTGDSVFFCDSQSMSAICERGILRVEENNGKYVLQIKKYLYDDEGIIDGNVLKSILHENNIFWKIGGTSEGTKMLNDLFSKEVFKNPKPVSLIQTLFYVSLNKNDIALDFFAGSGTSGQAIIELNKQDKGNRKIILIEMGDYFDSIICPRMKKVIYSLDWENGKPKSMNSIGGFFKYNTLEQYEDALENIEFKQTDIESFKLNRDVLFRYNFELGTKNSKTFLGADVENNWDNFNIITLDRNLNKIETKVDLVESFNYIIGLSIDKFVIKEDNKRKYLIIKGKAKDQQVFVIWRNPKDLEPQKDKDFIMKNILKGEKYDKLYVNSDCTVPNYIHIFDEFMGKLW